MKNKLENALWIFWSKQKLQLPISTFMLTLAFRYCSIFATIVLSLTSLVSLVPSCVRALSLKSFQSILAWNGAKSTLHLAHVNVFRRARHDKTEKNVRATRCSVFTTPLRARDSPMSARETSKKICGFTISDLSIGNLVGRCRATVSCCALKHHTNQDVAIGDLATGCLGVLAIGSLDVHVHVATKYVQCYSVHPWASCEFRYCPSSFHLIVTSCGVHGLPVILLPLGFSALFCPLVCLFGRNSKALSKFGILL